MTTKARDWEDELARFEQGPTRRRVYRLTSPGVAQVTRVRLLSAYRTSVRMRTLANQLIWEKPAPKGAAR